MAKSVKKTREQQYNESLAKSNTDLSKCVVLGFSFPDESHQHHSHFTIMGNTQYYLYDGVDERAVVITSNATGYADSIRKYAEYFGGVEYKPNLKV